MSGGEKVDLDAGGGGSEPGTPSGRGCLVKFIIVCVLLVGIFGAMLSFSGNAKRLGDFIFHKKLGYPDFSKQSWYGHSSRCGILVWDVPSEYLNIIIQTVEKKFNITCAGLLGVNNSPFYSKSPILADFYFIHAKHEKDIKRSQEKWLNSLKGKIPFVPLIIYNEWPKVSEDQIKRIVEKVLEGKTIQREQWSDGKSRKNSLVFLWGVPDVYRGAFAEQIKTTQSLDSPAPISLNHAILTLVREDADLLCVHNKYRAKIRNEYPEFEKFDRVIFDDWPLVSKKEALKKTKKLIRKFKIPHK